MAAEDHLLTHSTHSLSFAVGLLFGHNKITIITSEIIFCKSLPLLTDVSVFAITHSQKSFDLDEENIFKL